MSGKSINIDQAGKQTSKKVDPTALTRRYTATAGIHSKDDRDRSQPRPTAHPGVFESGLRLIKLITSTNWETNRQN